MKTLPVTTTEAVRRQGVITVNRNGVPFSITQTSSGAFKAFVSICPHDWVAMDQPPVRDDCLICPLHAVAFETQSGAVANARGKRVSGGLHEVQIDVCGDQIRLHVDGAVRRYVLMARLRRAARFVLRLGKRRRRPRKTTGPRPDLRDALGGLRSSDSTEAHEPPVPHQAEQGGRS